MKTKVCVICNQRKDIDQYQSSATTKDKLETRCKACIRAYKREWYQKNKEKRKSLAKENYQNNKEDKKRKRLERYYRNHKKERQQQKKYLENPENRRKKYQADARRLKEDINARLAHRLRTRLNTAIRKGYKSGSAVRDLGCTIPQFKKHIESLWQEGMTWHNWTTDGWHIDHIIPLCRFNLEDPEQFKQAVHYKNLQPLWAKDNLTKHRK